MIDKVMLVEKWHDSPKTNIIMFPCTFWGATRAEMMQDAQAELSRKLTKIIDDERHAKTK